MHCYFAGSLVRLVLDILKMVLKYEFQEELELHVL